MGPARFVGDEVDSFFGDEAEGGVFAAGNAEEVFTVPEDAVFAGTGGGIVAGTQERTHAGNGVEYGAGIGEEPADFGEEVVDIGRCGLNCGGVALPVGVGGADEGLVFPWDDEEDAVVASGLEGDGVLAGERGEEEVNAFGGAEEARAGEAFEPGAGGVDEKAGTDFVAGRGTSQVVVDAGDFTMFDTDGAEVGGVEDGFTAELGVVFPAIVVEDRAAQAGRMKSWFEGKCFGSG